MAKDPCREPPANKAADVGRSKSTGARGYSQVPCWNGSTAYARGKARLVDGADEVHQMVLNPPPRRGRPRLLVLGRGGAVMFNDPPSRNPRAGEFPAPHAASTCSTAASRRIGARPAVAWRDRVWTYGEFGGIVARLAAWLRARGVGAGDVVSVMLTNRPEEWLAAHFAVPALGAVLNTVNTRLSSEEVAYILDHAGSRLLLTEAALRPDLPRECAARDPAVQRPRRRGRARPVRRGGRRRWT